MVDGPSTTIECGQRRIDDTGAGTRMYHPGSDARQGRGRGAADGGAERIDRPRWLQKGGTSWNGRTSIGSVVAAAALRPHASAASRSGAVIT